MGRGIRMAQKTPLWKKDTPNPALIQQPDSGSVGDRAPHPPSEWPMGEGSRVDRVPRWTLEKDRCTHLFIPLRFLHGVNFSNHIPRLLGSESLFIPTPTAVLQLPPGMC